MFQVPYGSCGPWVEVEFGSPVWYCDCCGSGDEVEDELDSVVEVCG